jgi:hypothetical protein
LRDPRLRARSFLARAELIKHVDKIRLYPVEEPGERFYVAEGEWDITGIQPEKVKVAGAVLNGDFREVAGGGFEPPTFGL